MKKTLQMLSHHLTVALACSSAAIAVGQPQPSEPILVSAGVEVRPVRAAGLDARGRIITPWFDISGHTVSADCSEQLIFDSLELELCEATGDGGLFGFGPDYCNTYAINDIASLVADVPGGIEADRVALAWYWYGEGDPNRTEPCYLVVRTWEDFDDTCTGPAAANPYEGVILDFGELVTNPGGYYIADVPLCLVGLKLQMPFDREGAYSLEMWKFYNPDNGDFKYATCGQPMLWGQRTPRFQGSSGDIQWNDDVIRDGVHQAPDECDDLNLGTRLDPLGIAAAFYGDAACCLPCRDGWFCIIGTSDGVGWSWGFEPNEPIDVDPVPSGEPSSAIAQAFVESIENDYGGVAVIDPRHPNCFRILEPTFSELWVGDFGASELKCNVVNNGCVFNPQIHFFNAESAKDCLKLEVDQVIAGERTTFFLSGGSIGAKGALVYGRQLGETILTGQFGYCATFGIDGVRKNNLLANVTFSPNGIDLRSYRVPIRLAGKRLLFQAVEHGTCPDECVSNVVDVTFE